MNELTFTSVNEIRQRLRNGEQFFFLMNKEIIEELKHVNRIISSICREFDFLKEEEINMEQIDFGESASWVFPIPDFFDKEKIKLEDYNMYSSEREFASKKELLKMKIAEGYMNVKEYDEFLHDISKRFSSKEELIENLIKMFSLAIKYKNSRSLKQFSLNLELNDLPFGVVSRKYERAKIVFKCVSEFFDDSQFHIAQKTLKDL